VARRVSVDVSASRQILVRAPNWLGDLVMSTAGLRALRIACPDATISLQLREGLEPLLAGSPDVDRCIPLRREARRLVGLIEGARASRQPGGYDLGVCLPDSFSSALLMRASGVRRVVGYRRDGRGVLLDVAVSRDEHRRAGGLIAREQHVLGLLRAIGIACDDVSLRLATTPAEELAASALLERHGDGDDAVPTVVLAPGAGYGSSKCWPAERFADVGRALAGDGARVWLIGSAAETALCARVAAHMQAPSIDLSGRLDLGVLKAILRRASLLVCNDAGARHVAVAFGVPCIVFFGPTSVAKTPLNLEHVDVVEGDAACRPCYLRDCPIDHRCMTELAAAPVIGLARRRLAASLRPVLRSSQPVGASA
jgi:heptosyltransferase-2